jgi:hypothetical protein
LDTAGLARNPVESQAFTPIVDKVELDRFGLKLSQKWPSSIKWQYQILPLPNAPAFHPLWEIQNQMAV